jgi:hypothetical protein
MCKGLLYLMLLVELLLSLLTRGALLTERLWGFTVSTALLISYILRDG